MKIDYTKIFYGVLTIVILFGVFAAVQAYNYRQKDQLQVVVNDATKDISVQINQRQQFYATDAVVQAPLSAQEQEEGRVAAKKVVHDLLTLAISPQGRVTDFEKDFSFSKSSLFIFKMQVSSVTDGFDTSFTIEPQVDIKSVKYGSDCYGEWCYAVTATISQYDNGQQIGFVKSTYLVLHPTTNPVISEIFTDFYQLTDFAKGRGIIHKVSMKPTSLLSADGLEKLRQLVFYQEQILPAGTKALSGFYFDRRVGNFYDHSSFYSGNLFISLLVKDNKAKDTTFRKEYGGATVEVTLSPADQKLAPYLQNPLYCEIDSDCGLGGRFCSSGVSNGFVEIRTFGCESGDGAVTEADKKMCDLATTHPVLSYGTPRCVKNTCTAETRTVTCGPGAYSEGP